MGAGRVGTSSAAARLRRARDRSVSAEQLSRRRCASVAPAAPGATAIARGAGERDIRRKRPPALSFLLRMSTLRARRRVVSLLALDFAGVGARDLHRAGAQGSRPRDGRACSNALHGTEAVPAVRLPAHGAAVRALGPLRRARPAARAAADRRLAVPGRVRRADLRGRQRRTLLQLLPVLRLARVRDLLRVLAARRLRARHRRAAARRRLPAPRGARRTRQADRATSPTRWLDGPHAPIEVVGFLSPAPLPDNGLRSLGSLADLERVLDASEVDEVIIADPDFPQDDAVELVDQLPPARRARAARALDDGDPDPPRRVRARPVGAAVRARPAGVRGHRLRAQADLRHRSARRLLLVVLSPLLLAITLAVRLSSRGPDPVPLDAPRHRPAAVRRA